MTMTTTTTRLRRLRWGVRATLTLGVAASVFANILHAQNNPISQSISAWPPLALLLTVELISRVPVHRRSLAAARLISTAAIAGIAAWVSYWHMAAVAARYGETGASPYLLPLSVDGLIVVASICLVELSGRITTLDREPAHPPATQPADSPPAPAHPEPVPPARPAPVHREPPPVPATEPAPARAEQLPLPVGPAAQADPETGTDPLCADLLGQVATARARLTTGAAVALVDPAPGESTRRTRAATQPPSDSRRPVTARVGQRHQVDAVRLAEQYEQLTAQLQREPTGEELGAAAGCSKATANRWKRERELIPAQG